MATLIWLQLSALIILLFFSAFFSGSETALTSLGKLRAKRLLTDLEDGDNSSFAARLKYWLNNSQKILISILIGNNLVNIAASALATVVATKLFREIFDNPLAWGSGIAVGIITLLVLIFGEIMPKSYAKQNPEIFARLTIGPIMYFTRLVTPFIVILKGISHFFIRMFGGKMPEEHTRITEEELKKLVLAGRQEGTLEETELQMLHSVFEFDETVVREIMIPRTDLEALEVNEDYYTVRKTFRRTGFSRIPVYEDKLDHIVGILNIKDFINRFDHSEPENFDLREIVRPPYFVPESKKVNQLLADFRRNQVHLAVVVDEYGGTSGIITMEDIIEEIVGEIHDEYDERRDWVLKVDDDLYLVDARIDLDDLEQQLELDLPARVYDSLGGMLIEEMGKIPEEGEKLDYEDLEFEVVSANRKRVKKVRLVLPSAGKENK